VLGWRWSAHLRSTFFGTWPRWGDKNCPWLPVHQGSDYAHPRPRLTTKGAAGVPKNLGTLPLDGEKCDSECVMAPPTSPLTLRVARSYLDHDGIADAPEGEVAPGYYRKLALRGFTLVELMIVVAIVGILAVLGIVAYRKFVLSAHTSEATHMVQSIRVAESTYHAETQNYVSTSVVTDATSGLYPIQNSPPGSWKTPWTTPVGVCPPAQQDPNCFALLPVHSDGPVMFGYATLAGPASAPVPAIALQNGVTLNGPAGGTLDWFWITASANTTNAAKPNWSYVVANSFTNDLYVQDQ
jgi:prepilin-type N-terminal cleavage/methylation domain-containing protein